MQLMLTDGVPVEFDDVTGLVIPLHKGSQAGVVDHPRHHHVRVDHVPAPIGPLIRLDGPIDPPHFRLVCLVEGLNVADATLAQIRKLAGE